MLPRSELALKIICAIAGTVLLFQAGRAGLRGNALAGIRIPQLPTLTNAPAAANTGAWASAQGSATIKSGSKTNPPAPIVTGGTNQLPGGTNTGSPSANIAAAPPAGLPMGMLGPAPGGARHQLPPLPNIIQARLDRVVDSELLGPVMRPMPMALLGIGGTHVFLRAPNGQTGLVKEGESLGGVKLLKVGINRVLVEEDGQNKELTMFNGLGGETLMPTAKTNIQ